MSEESRSWENYETTFTALNSRHIQNTKFRVEKKSVGKYKENNTINTLHNCRICYLDEEEKKTVDGCNSDVYSMTILRQLDNRIVLQFSKFADIAPSTIPKAGLHPFCFVQKIGETNIMGFKKVYGKIIPTD